MNILSDFDKNKKIFFIGIGGIGMSALAMILKDVGFQICGSDISQNNNIKNLQKNDIQCFIGHDASQIDDNVGLVVFTSIIAKDNPELIEAKTRNIKIFSRAEVLDLFLQQKRSITIAGTHGKTTITTIVSNLLDGFGLNVDVVNGGIINSYNSNYKIGAGNLIVAESDESDGSFANLKTDIAVISNIEPEHMEYYNNDFAKVIQSYENYIKSAKEVAIICLDDPQLFNLYNKLKNKVNFITYGEREAADFSLKSFFQNKKGICFSFYSKIDGKEFSDIKVGLYGLHNAKNALSAIAIAKYLSCDLGQLNKAFNFYQGVQRRFTKISNGNNFTIIDDYAHHPTEITATINAARQLVEKGQLIVVFQAHKISRLQDLFTEFVSSFSQADIVIVLDVYEPDPHKKHQISRQYIAQEIRQINAKSRIIDLANDQLEDHLKNKANSDDVVLFIGAGDISLMARGLAKVDDNDVSYRQALHRSVHRGCKETDVLLGQFAQSELKNFSNNQLNLYSQLIQEDDVYIYDWILSKIVVKDQYINLISMIRKFHNL